MEINPDMRFLMQGKRSHLEFLPDSAEQLAHSIDATGLRDKSTQAFQAAIARARRPGENSSQAVINETKEVDTADDAPLK